MAVDELMDSNPVDEAVDATEEQLPNDDQELSEGEQVSETPSEKNEVNGLMQALHAERGKRQDMEARIKELEGKLAPRPEGVKWDDDPQGWTAQELTKQRITLSEEFARDKHEDYDEVTSGFETIAKSEPTTLRAFLDAANPAMFAYRLCKQRQEVASAGSIDEIKRKAVEEATAAILARLENKTGRKIPAELVSGSPTRAPSSASLSVFDLLP